MPEREDEQSRYLQVLRGRLSHKQGRTLEWLTTKGKGSSYVFLNRAYWVDWRTGTSAILDSDRDGVSLLVHLRIDFGWQHADLIYRTFAFECNQKVAQQIASNLSIPEGRPYSALRQSHSFRMRHRISETSCVDRFPDSNASAVAIKPSSPKVVVFLGAVFQLI